MKAKKWLSACTAAVCGLSLLTTMPQRTPAQTASAAKTITNPFIYSDVPDDDVIKVGDTYYMVSTTMFFCPGVPIMKSDDLLSWQICNYVYDTYADGDKQNLKSGQHDYAHGQWATSLRYDNGWYYVFFGSYGTGNSYIYKTQDIENGKWTRTEIRGMYHDASMLFDTDGRKYLVYGSGEIKIKEFNDDMTGFKSGGLDKTLFKTSYSGLSGEGSRALKIGDYYYVFIIAWPSGRKRIEIAYRSKSLTGNFETKEILDSGLGTYGSGVAQGTLIEGPGGQWYALLFQDHGSVGRVPVLVPAKWENGWPVLGNNGAAPTTLTVPDDYKGTYLAHSDDFDYAANDLALEWQWNHNPDNSAWSVTDRPGYLRLTNKTIANNILWARNTLTMRTEGPKCSSYIKLDTSGMKPGDYAGLSAFQFNYGNVGVYVTDDGSRKVYMAKNGGSEIANSSNKIIEETNMNGKEIYLKVNFNFADINGSNVGNNIDKADFFYSYDGDNWTKIGETLGMTYDLKLFTGYRSGIYSYPTKNTGGYADIDYFGYERAEFNEGTGYTQPELDDDGYWFHYTFEKNTENFSGRGSASIAQSGDEAYEGSKSLACNGREASWNGALHSLSSSVFKPGTAYSFSTVAKYTSGSATDTFHFTLQYTGSDGETHYDKIATEVAVKGEWVQLSNPSYTIPEGASGMMIYVETDDSTNSFYIDEMIGAPEGTVIAGPGKSSFVLGDCDGNGKIDARDLSIAKKLVLNDSSSNAKADVDQNTVVTVADVLWIQKYILGLETAYPPKADPPKAPASDYPYPSSVPYKEAPGNYFQKSNNPGKLINESYNGINGANKLNVYLPPNYDSSKQYNILYMMHGGGENENVLINDSDKFYINYLVENMINNGEVDPMIVVFPTFNKTEAADVWKEMRESIVPFVEGKYSTYAKSTSAADLEASRMHRAYGGFSMGGGSTWNVLINCNDYFAYYMPLSGHCWGGAQPILNVMGGKYKDSTYVFAATGTEDIAYGNMCNLINDLKKSDVIRYGCDFSKDNFYFLEVSGKTHWWGFVKHYIYDGLPLFFREGQ